LLDAISDEWPERQTHTHTHTGSQQSYHFEQMQLACVEFKKEKNKKTSKTKAQSCLWHGLVPMVMWPSRRPVGLLRLRLVPQTKESQTGSNQRFQRALRLLLLNLTKIEKSSFVFLGFIFFPRKMSIPLFGSHHETE
jgi:hypothetical protein